MKIKLEKPHCIDGVWVQPANPDGTGGYVTEVTAAVAESMRLSGTKFTEIVEPKVEPKKKVKDEQVL